nr:unnamed protein product [Digitaria exilis]
MSTRSNFQEMDGVLVLAMCFLVFLPGWACGLGSMSSIAVSYGEDGPVFCGLSSDGSHLVTCFGADASVLYGAPPNIPFLGLTAGDGFVCGLLLDTRQPYCWGSNSYVKSGVPQPMIEGAKYSELSAGDNHLCALRAAAADGIHGANDGAPLIDCWGYNMTATHVLAEAVTTISAGSVFNCGLFARNRTVFCWGDETVSGVIGLTPRDLQFQSIGAGGYHVCGVLENAQVFCWGRSLEMQQATPSSAIGDGNVNIVPMDAMVSVVGGRFHACGIKSLDHQVACWGFTLHNSTSPPKGLKMYVLVAGDYFTCGVPAETSLMPSHGYYEYVNHGEVSSSKDNMRIQPDVENLKVRRAQEFSYAELEQATCGFSEDSQVGKGSFSCVFKGTLRDGSVVAVKRAIKASDMKKSSKEFHNELDLLSRLNHAHLLNLLGYCEDGSERLLVYEFMAHGSLHQHLHGNNPSLKRQLNWARRVTIAVQAARGIEYLHGYACPPVIHRDIKSSNILIDEDHNARVADFGLSILGPADSGTPLSELPAGTLGYLDPEYYRLHYLTTKSDVYSFGVFLLEILSGRKAIDMQFDEGNIVEWAVPLIKAGDIFSILDPVLSPPSDLEALKKIASVACKCVRMRGKDRPSMDKVTTALEHALALLMGSPLLMRFFFH